MFREGEWTCLVRTWSEVDCEPNVKLMLLVGELPKFVVEVLMDMDSRADIRLRGCSARRSTPSLSTPA